jgi:hypothetical protein
MPGLTATKRIGLILHPQSDPTLVAEKLVSWARSHGKQVIAEASDAARLPEGIEPVALSLLDASGGPALQVDGAIVRRMEPGESIEVRLRPRAGLVGVTARTSAIP